MDYDGYIHPPTNLPVIDTLHPALRRTVIATATIRGVEPAALAAEMDVVWRRDINPKLWAALISACRKTSALCEGSH
jgi:hypothetical protein